MTTTVTLTVRTVHTAKDQLKANQATKFIGRGSARSSTNQYSKDFGDLANTGIYTSEDRVFISSEGNRVGRVTPDFDEILKAVKARATLITDNLYNRSRTYNIGEREVAEFISSHGYKEAPSGIWKPSN